MQMVKKIFIVLGLGWFAILLFMPKQELYYKLEEILEKKSIKINEQSIHTGLFSLRLENVDIYAKGIKLATAESVDFFTLLFYTKVEVDNLVLDDSLKKLAPTHIDELVISHGIGKPFQLQVEAKGVFGALDGNINLNKKIIRLNFDENSSIEQLKSKLEQDDKGWYYEASF